MNYTLNDNLKIDATPVSAGKFEQCYIAVRNREQRIYTDKEVLLLPDISDQHVHHKEWLSRKTSSDRFINYLKKKNRSLNILEVGCGNGWLSNRLSKLSGAMVTGIDINVSELQQAERVFGNRSSLEFIYGDISTETVTNKQFDIIVFAASIQYFSSLTLILHNAIQLLQSKGEIHILDSLFYQPHEVSSARKRSRTYYQQLGFSEMAAHYFHHSLDELKKFNYKILHDPASLKNKFFNNTQPLYWICVKKTEGSTSKAILSDPDN